MAIAAVHSKRRTTQSAVFIDERMSEQARSDLLGLIEDAARGYGKDDNLPLLDGLARLLGTIVQSSVARIELTSPSQSNDADKTWNLVLSYHESKLAEATFRNAYMTSVRKAINDSNQLEKRAKPLSLTDTALHDELSLRGETVVQDVDRFDFSISSLPGAPFSYAGRSGMSSQFDYSRPSRHG